MINKISLVLLVLVVSSCASLPENNQQVPSYVLPISETSNTRLANGFLNKKVNFSEHPKDTGIYLLGSGHDAFVARAVLANQADKTLDVQYYLYHGDLSGKILMAQLLAAADRGVRVRLLVDDMDLADRDFSIAMVDAHENFEIRIWNPFIRGSNRTAQFVTRFGSVTRRMHNKSFTADNQVAIVGGRNIGNEYFGADPDVTFGDLDAALVGEAVKKVSESFDQYWNHSLAYPITTLYSNLINEDQALQKRKEFDAYIESQKTSEYSRMLANSNLAKKILRSEVEYSWARADIFSDSPDKTEADRDREDLHLITRLGPYLLGAKKELVIVSPYFVPGEQGTKTLTDLVEQGVEVKVLTNSLASNDVEVVHAGYSKYRKDLLKGGVQLFEMSSTLKDIEGPSEKRFGMSKSSLHAKYFSIDRQKAFIGSLNLDPRSVVENTEIGVMIYDETISRGIAEHFDENIMDIAFRLEIVDGDIVWQQKTEDGVVTLYTEPNTGFWQRFKVGFMSFLPGESQL